ncbi:pantoate--beta-alanine ligase [Candidatus Desulforudis audaxviator]|uniref:Pantothenate synthetase n=1 Tax=Desulforudis audaxviator (strain MP104C) TaxID=477974 RepID=B1I1N8_DESAP|nr:pantoate--beta-alanine ligase [Candidatus Desulforudis audaxviator]ACA58669.1 pantoate--beta-alanine ligase [Candidatus Desulforudis audaxviator MP104C]AZK58669.1 Pantoate--beta-alanine ligase [Candidatus Desulforudis audaxviator]
MAIQGDLGQNALNSPRLGGLSDLRVCATVAEIRDVVAGLRRSGGIALVPTMGYFHEGHLTLMREARRRFPYVVVSIFVNPIQFGPNEDLEAYPRNLERDLRLAREAGVTAVFVPGTDEMYPDQSCTFVQVDGISGVLCGRSRPGHFRGVATVVAKLFNIVRPDAAFFGWKDAQQVLVVRRLVRDLNLDVEIIAVPTVREPDGLAMSSRNTYLSPAERRAATVLYRSLLAAREAVLSGEGLPAVRDRLAAAIAAEPAAGLEYAEILALPGLTAPGPGDRELLLAVAARFGRARLIDNVVVRLPGEMVRSKVAAVSGGRGNNAPENAQV